MRTPIADGIEAEQVKNDTHDERGVAVSKMNCPHCNHKPFRNETGLKWHLEHIHGNVKPGSGFSRGPIQDNKLKKDDPADHEQNLVELKRESEEKLDTRLRIFTERDAWLSERITKLERTIDSPEVD